MIGGLISTQKILCTFTEYPIINNFFLETPIINLDNNTITRCMDGTIIWGGGGGGAMPSLIFFKNIIIYIYMCINFSNFII